MGASSDATRAPVANRERFGVEIVRSDQNVHVVHCLVTATSPSCVTARNKSSPWERRRK